MISFLIDTFVATGALIVLVLVLRRPVGRVFGPQCAYALWLLPLLRFVMPPILLPASFGPEPAVALVMPAVPDAAALAQVPLEFEQAAPAAVAATEPAAAAIIPWTELLLGVWIGVALGFLVWRFVTYRRMRRDLLAEARPVGEVGKIRLVETPAVSAPVAFGLIDKVVALPLFFMVLEDRSARDLAIAHELAHHRGRDLAANILAQPLLALHWFDPLAWLAWRAMRRDQEAACDARVMAECGRIERTRYAEVIASFAAGPRLALAAPMACPVLGEKSIIHRLRSLKMDDISRRRRLLGRGLVIAAGLALPLTATVSYAQNELDLPPAPPAPPEVPAVPAPPLPPEAPLPPGAVVVEKDGVRTFVLRREGPDGEPQVRQFTWRGTPPIPAIPAVPAMPNFEFHAWGDADDPEFEKKMEQWGAQMEKWGAEYGERYAEQAQAHAQAWAQAAPQVVHSCDGNPQQVATHSTTSDGRQKIVICERVATRQALGGLRSARETIARDRQIDPEVRDEVVQELDEEIERIENDG